MKNFIHGNASIITINRGDSVYFPLFINAGDEVFPIRYRLQEGDRLYFGIMEPNRYWEQSIVKKIFTNESEMTCCGDVIIHLTPEDTEYLIPGTYYYMIKLLRQDGDSYDVTTIVDKTLFYIV